LDKRTNVRYDGEVVQSYQTDSGKGCFMEQDPFVLEQISDYPEKQPKKKSVQRIITVDKWKQLTFDEQRLVLSGDTGKSIFNKTNSNVEWALWTWNPVTGCLHDCDYCYARDIAIRFYEYLPVDSRFAPVFYPDRLSAPTNTKKPNLTKISDPVRKLGLQNVFVCSMADLFGKWVPNEWIKAVLKQVWSNPQWNFLFLTKFPIRMSEFEYPSNAWLGTTVDRQYAVERAEKAFQQLKNKGYSGIAWLSCEPLMEHLTFNSLNMFDWVVIGGASKSTRTPEFYPPRDWVIHLENQARLAGCMLYEKTNLHNLFKKTGPIERIREYPTSPQSISVQQHPLVFEGTH
jgi:protein gp37